MQQGEEETEHWGCPQHPNAAYGYHPLRGKHLHPMRPPYHTAEGGILMNHDEFVNFLARESRKLGSDDKVVEIETEAHYNYYGTRGVADLVRLQGTTYEWKSASIVEAKTHLEKAHETIRQFKKMIRFFYKDEDRTRPERVIYELTILPTEHNFEHLREYKELYSSAAGKEVAGFKSKAIITFRGPSEYTPIPIFADTIFDIDTDGWWEMAEGHNSEAAARIQGEAN